MGKRFNALFFVVCLLVGSVTFAQDQKAPPPVPVKQEVATVIAAKKGEILRFISFSFKLTSRNDDVTVYTEEAELSIKEIPEVFEVQGALATRLKKLGGHATGLVYTTLEDSPSTIMVMFEEKGTRVALGFLPGTKQDDIDVAVNKFIANVRDIYRLPNMKVEQKGQGALGIGTIITA